MDTDKPSVLVYQLKYDDMFRHLTCYDSSSLTLLGFRIGNMIF